MDINTLDFIYKAFITVMVIMVGYGTYLNIQDYRSITKWEKENK